MLHYNRIKIMQIQPAVTWLLVNGISTLSIYECIEAIKNKPSQCNTFKNVYKECFRETYNPFANAYERSLLDNFSNGDFRKAPTSLGHKPCAHHWENWQKCCSHKYLTITLYAFSMLAAYSIFKVVQHITSNRQPQRGDINV